MSTRLTIDRFAGTYSGVFRSLAADTTWTVVNNGLSTENDNVSALAVDGNDVLFAGTEGGLYRSMDNGNTWDPVFVAVGSFAVGSNGDVFAGGENGVFRSTNGGDSWPSFNSGLTIKRILSLALNNDGDLFAGTDAGGVFKTTGATDPFVAAGDAYSKPKLTLKFRQMSPHVGQKFEVRVIDADRDKEVGRHSLSAVPGADFDIAIYSIVKGHSYRVDFYADHNGNGEYDSPPTDHAWRMQLNSAQGNDQLTFTHNTNFTDVGWEPFLGASVYEAIWKGVAYPTGEKTGVPITARILLNIEEERAEGRVQIAELLNVAFSGPMVFDGDTIRVDPTEDVGKISGLSGSFKFSNYGRVDADLLYEALGQSVDLQLEGTLGQKQALFNYNSAFFGSQGVVVLEEDSVLVYKAVAVEQPTDLPAESTLLVHNFPNPFKSATTIEYDLPLDASVSLTIYDYLGRRVTVLNEGLKGTGMHAVTYDGSDLPSGVYFLKVEAALLSGGSTAGTSRLMVVR